MMRLMILIGMTIGSWAGWWLGAQFSDGMGLPLALSSVGTIAGIVVGWKIARNIEE